MNNEKINNVCLMEALLYYSIKGNTTIKEMKNSIFFNTRNTKYISYEDVCNTIIRCFVQELHMSELEKANGIYLKKH